MSVKLLAGLLTMTLGAAGNYSVQWSNMNNMVVGKGWKPGSATHVVNYTGSFSPNGNALNEHPVQMTVCRCPARSLALAMSDMRGW